MNIYGYIRVSTKEQNEDRQLIAMNGLSISRGCLFIDKQSGKDFERPAYKRMIKRMKKTTCSTSRALTVWVGIMRRFNSSGGSSQKTRAWIFAL